MADAIDIRTRKSVTGYATQAELDTLAETVQSVIDILDSKK